MAVGEMEGEHAEGVEEGDDFLDAALDMELAASFAKHPLPEEERARPPPDGEGARGAAPPPPQEATSSHLSFAFPGWEIDMAKGAKRKAPLISRHSAGASHKKGRHRGSARAAGPSEERPPPAAWESPAGGLGAGCPADAADDELLACVLSRLGMRDLCASMRTCKRWHRVACREDVWEHIPLPMDKTGALPRWMRVRNDTVSSEVRVRFLMFRKGYEFVRLALDAWWALGRPDDERSSATIRLLTRKLVVNDWSLLYEALGATFSDRADHIAVIVLAAVEQARASRDANAGYGKKDGPSGGLNKMLGAKRSKMKGDGRGAGAAEEDASWDESDVCEVWALVLSLWRRYKHWLMLVTSHCPALNHEVMTERARGNALALTPTVYGKGVICSRSQVILKYGIRSVLQAMWTGLASAKRTGTSSDAQIDLFRSADHLFQEMGVPDDLTLPSTTFTQHKLRRCFRNDATFRS